MTGAERIFLCYSIQLLTAEVKMERFIEGLPGIKWLLDEEEVNLDSLNQTSDNRVLCNEKWQEPLLIPDVVGWLLIPSPRTRTVGKAAARLKPSGKRKFFMQQDFRERKHRLKYTKESY